MIQHSLIFKDEFKLKACVYLPETLTTMINYNIFVLLQREIASLFFLKKASLFFLLLTIYLLFYSFILLTYTRYFPTCWVF